MRLGLCCLFVEQDIRFRTTTATTLGRLNQEERADKPRHLAAHNAASLYAAIDYCTT